MRSKDTSRNKMVEHKKRTDRQKKDIDNKERIVEKTKAKKITKDDATDGMIKHRTTKEIAQNNATNEIITGKKKKPVRKKLSKEHMDEIKRRAEERAYRGIGSDEKFHEEPKHEISAEERAKRFKRLHEMAMRMTDEWKEKNK